MKKQIYHIVYRTVNIVNGKSYIGVHSTVNLSDGYIGGGIKRQSDAERKKGVFPLAVSKYGYNNFKREIISLFDCVEKAYEEEARLVNKDWVKLKSNYNVSVGGRFSVMSKKGRAKLSERMKKKNPSKINGIAESTRLSVSKKCKDSFWSTNGIETIKIHKGEALPNGFYKGVSENSPMRTLKKGVKNPKWKGYWITPYGWFESLSEVSKYIGKGKTYVMDRCRGYRYQSGKDGRYKQYLKLKDTKGWQFIELPPNMREACGS